MEESSVLGPQNDAQWTPDGPKMGGLGEEAPPLVDSSSDDEDEPAPLVECSASSDDEDDRPSLVSSCSDEDFERLRFALQESLAEREVQAEGAAELEVGFDAWQKRGCSHHSFGAKMKFIFS